LKAKKLIALALAAVLMFTFAACGGTGTQTSPSPDAQQSAAPAPAESAAPTDDAAAGTTEVLKIGALANLTGWFSVIDSANVNELKAMAKIINEGGSLKVGDKTYTIELDIQDGQSDATGVRNAAQILADNGCKYVIETNDFWVEGALDIFENAGIMNIQAQNNMDFKAINKDLKYAYTFNNGAASSYDSAFQAFKAKYPDVKKIVYCQNDDGVNDASIKLVKDLCTEYGYEYVDAPVIYDANATDFSAVALQVIASGADAFIGNGQPNNIASILKEIRSNGDDMVCAAIITMNAGVLLAVAGADAADNAFSLGPDFTNESNNTEIFWKIYQQVIADYGEEAAGNFSGTFANCLYVLTNLMQGARSVEVADVQDFWDKLDAVDTIFGPGVPGGTETYGVNHLICHPNPLSMLVKGEIQFGGWYDTKLP